MQNAFHARSIFASPPAPPIDAVTIERGERHGAVYRALIAPGPIGPGLEGAVGRAQTFYRRLGDAHALGLLDAMSLAAFGLRQALFARDAAGCATVRATLAGLAADWLQLAPLFSLDDLLGEAGTD